MHDLDSIYQVPLVMQKQGALEFLKFRFNLIDDEYSFMKQWKRLSEKYCII